jgi:hypothetical protein
MKTLSAPPGAKRLIDSLRNLGYDCSTAIADLIDNSLAAEATEVSVDIFPKAGQIPAHVIIADNGHGMDQDGLHEAMRFGAFQEYQEDDLGKYGLGLKTASLSQCKVMTVLSRPRKSGGGIAKRTMMRWDLDYVFQKDTWEVQVPESNELKAWENTALDSPLAKKNGTVVLWTDLEKTHSGLSSESASRRERDLGVLIAEVELHLRMVFHRFLQGAVPGRKKLVLTVCGKKVEAWDPFCAKEKATVELEPLKFQVSKYFPEAADKRGQIILHPFILPREDEFSSREAHKDAAGPRNWNYQQGFYYYRNNRLLQSGGWSNLRTPDEHNKLLRIVVQFPPNLDTSFSLNITKMKAHFPPEIREEVKTAISKWAVESRAVYSRGPKVSTKSKATVEAEQRAAAASRPALKIGGMSFAIGGTPSKELSVIVDRKTGDIRVTVPFRHESAKLFEKLTGKKGDLKLACRALITVLVAVQEGKLRATDIPMNAIRRGLKRIL